MDEAYFGGPSEEPKRGRETNKMPVLVAMALSPQGRPKYLKMHVVENVKIDTLTKFIEQSLDPSATVVNNGFYAYKKPNKYASQVDNEV